MQEYRNNNLHTQHVYPSPVLREFRNLVQSINHSSRLLARLMNRLGTVMLSHVVARQRLVVSLLHGLGRIIVVRVDWHDGLPRWTVTRKNAFWNHFSRAREEGKRNRIRHQTTPRKLGVQLLHALGLERFWIFRFFYFLPFRHGVNGGISLHYGNFRYTTVSYRCFRHTYDAVTTKTI